MLFILTDVSSWSEQSSSGGNETPCSCRVQNAPQRLAVCKSTVDSEWNRTCDANLLHMASKGMSNVIFHVYNTTKPSCTITSLCHHQESKMFCNDWLCTESTCRQAAYCEAHVGRCHIAKYMSAGSILWIGRTPMQFRSNSFAKFFILFALLTNQAKSHFISWCYRPVFGIGICADIPWQELMGVLLTLRLISSIKLLLCQ